MGELKYKLDQVTFLESIYSRELIRENYSLILFSLYFGLAFRIWSTLCYIKTSAIPLKGLETFSSVFVLGGFTGLLTCYLLTTHSSCYEVYNYIIFRVVHLAVS